MLFEVVTKANPIGITGDDFMERLSAGRQYMKELREKGAVVHSWVRIGEYGATVIFDVDSHADLIQYLYGNPLVPHIEFKITPLVKAEDYD